MYVEGRFIELIFATLPHEAALFNIEKVLGDFKEVEVTCTVVQGALRLCGPL